MQRQIQALKKENADLKNQILSLKSQMRISDKKREERIYAEALLEYRERNEIIIQEITTRAFIEANLRDGRIDALIKENQSLRKHIDPLVFEIAPLADIFRYQFMVRGSYIGELSENIVNKMDDLKELELKASKLRAEILADLSYYVENSQGLIRQH